MDLPLLMAKPETRSRAGGGTGAVETLASYPASGTAAMELSVIYARGRGERGQWRRREIGEYLATSKRIAKVAFTGSTEVVSNDAIRNAKHYSGDAASWRSPNIFFADVMDEEDAFFIKRWKALHCLPLTRAKFAPVRVGALVQELLIYERFMEAPSAVSKAFAAVS
ncbi:hypothetical protein ACLB1M_28145 [Escherichia coli]